MLKKWICLLLVILLPTAAAAEYVMAGYEPDTARRTWSTNAFFARMQERSGVDFTYRQFSSEEEWTRYKATLTAADPDLPDLLFKAALTPAECITLLDRGVLVDLAPLLEENCPHLWDYLLQHPDWLRAITLPDGRIGALPYLSLQPMQNCLWINTDWMKTLGLDMPATADDLTDVLRAFRDRDPNGNGRKDEIPLAFLGTFDLKFLAHAYGLAANDFNIFAEDGRAHYLPLEPRYRDFVEWLHLLWSEGLLDRNGFSTSDSLRAVTDAKAAKVYGSALTTLISNFLPVDWVSSYAVVPPLTWNGTQVYRSFIGEVITGTAAVTAHCADAAQLLAWLDLFYTEDIAVLASSGLENTDYVFDGDGTWRMTSSASENTYFSAESTISTGTAIPGVSTEAFQAKYHDTAVQYLAGEVRKINEIARRPFPYYALNAQQEAKAAELQNALAPIVDQALALWITGETPITDASFAAFEQQLAEAGANEMIAFWQAILEEQTQP